jgi:hypothetical protein
LPPRAGAGAYARAGKFHQIAFFADKTIGSKDIQPDLSKPFGLQKKRV